MGEGLKRAVRRNKRYLWHIFFNYDKGENRHHIFGYEVENEKNQIVGFRPVVMAAPKKGGVMTQISDQYPQVKYKVFSTEKLARDFAIDFFNQLRQPIATYIPPHQP